MDEIIDRLEWRYAVKKFDGERILPEEDIDTLKNAFNLTATSYGLQPIKLVVLKNKEIQHQLQQYSFKQPQVAQASHVLVFCIETNIDEDYISNYFKRVKKVRGTSDEILDPFKKDLQTVFSSLDRKEIEIWARNQAYLAMGNLLTICAIKKIDSCPMEGFLPDGYSQVLGLDNLGLSPVLVLPVGYRAADDKFSEFKKVRRSMSKSVVHIH